MSYLLIPFFDFFSANDIAAGFFLFASDWLADQLFQRNLEFPIGNLKFHAHDISSQSAQKERALSRWTASAKSTIFKWSAYSRTFVPSTVLPKTMAKPA
jgi:hypothetical protein